LILGVQRLAFLVASALLGACTSGPPATKAINTTSAMVPVAPEREPAYGLVMQASSCWMGGLWSDASGEKGDARTTGIRRRCDMVLHAMGESPEGSYYPLRAVDSTMVDLVAWHTERFAREDAEDAADRAHSAELVTLLRLVADAARETMHARRAADTVKRDIARAPVRPAYHADKIVAAPSIVPSAGLHALLTTDVGPYSAEARTIGLLNALDRVEIASGLPKHLKIYAVQGAFQEVFGVYAPKLPEDAASRIAPGTWLSYLDRVSRAAGHPVTDEAGAFDDREALAYEGVLHGFADRLGRLEPVLVRSPDLAAVSHAIAARLEAHEAFQRAVFEAKPIPK
jgi:hypothetical protein